MSLAPGTRLGAYEIIALIGAGGMGEVYRARDSRLNRDVAIKILPDAFASDAERLARFKREAQVLASLNHPHIAAIYGLEETPSGNALVLELVDGPTLADRIAQGPIPLDEALPIARQIAEALEAAHERGVIHRDLKPANIKLTADGKVKVLDFGLAKALDGSSPGGQAGNLSQSPTITSPAMTMGGVILGTAAYMSPEQAKGRSVDKRTDIWAFGCVLYEMLTGKRPFEGDDATETIAAIVRGEPDWECLPRLPAIHRLLTRCLEKNCRDRLADIADVRFELNEAAKRDALPSQTSGIVLSNGWPLIRNQRAAWVLTGLLAIMFPISLFLITRNPEPPQKFAFEVTAPDAIYPLQFALSPTGTQLVTISGSSLRSLWLRPLDRVDGRLLQRTEGASRPFFSSDGRSIGYFAGGKLRTIDIQAGGVQTLADAPRPQGGTWNGDTIVYAPDDSGPLFRINTSGGAPIQVTELDKSRQETGHWHPMFSDDGRYFLFVARSNTPENSGVYLATLGSKERTRLVDSATKAMFAGQDHILFAGDRVLMAQQFDKRRGTVRGDPFNVADSIGHNALLGDAGFAASFAGTVAHRGGLLTNNPITALTWFDRAGRPLGTLGTPGRYRNPRLAPDGSRVAVQRANDERGGSTDLWLIDVARHVPTRFTFAEPGAFHHAPLWSPDGSHIAWEASSGRGSKRTVFQKLVNGTERDEKVRDMPAASVIDDWSDIGILFHDGSNLSGTGGLRVLPTDGGELSSLNGDVRSIVTHARVSPDRQWIAFAASDTGRPEIYIQNFPISKDRIQISSTGGIQPVWRPDGRELFFLAPDGKMLAVPVRLSERVFVGPPVALFATKMEGGGTQSPGIWHQYDVSRDGQRFLINELTDHEDTRRELPITVLVNWLAGSAK